MDPMPPLEHAVHSYPPRVDPPTFMDLHPRLKAGIDLLFPILWVVLMVLRLQRDGFHWLPVSALAVAAGLSGAGLATFPSRGASAEASATV
ncbi:hypothetical protein ACOCJ7_01985 [Knoellia sp. CPCC 206453]|uniref:hypothetical protein n=1 Tax=Knoellia pratensis TaxID=3404796 RepID=UPI003605F911